MNGKPMSREEAYRIVAKDIQKQKTKTVGKPKKPKRKATPEESEMGWILVTAAFLFFCGYFYFKTGQMPF